MASYRVKVARILAETGADMTVEGELPLDELVIGEESFRHVRPPRIHLTLINTGTGIVAQGTVDALLAARCSRCLCDFELPLTAEVEAFYIRSERAEEIPDDQEWEPIGDDSVDVAPAVEATLALEAPYAPLHDEACAGICARCGTDLNTGECSCPGEEATSPFAVLKERFGRGEDEGGE